MDTPENVEIQESTHEQVTSVKVNLKKKIVEGTIMRVTTIKKVDKDTKAELDIQKYYKSRIIMSNRPPHRDFVNSLKMLRKPAMQIVEQNDFANFDQYTVTGFSLSGMDSDEDAGIVLSVQKKLRNGRVWSFNTTFTPLGENEEYGDSERLDTLAAAVCQEFIGFDNGKFGEDDDPQMKLKFEDGTEASMRVTKSRGSRKKAGKDAAAGENIGLEVEQSEAEIPEE